MASLERNRDTIVAPLALGTDDARPVRRSAVASRAMRRSRRLALAMSVCALAAPALAQAQTTTTPTTTSPTTTAPSTGTVPSPFKADRGASKPSGLTPDNTTAPVKYPEQSVILTWGDVPKAAGYTVEISDTPGFSRTVWTAKTTQAIAVPDILLPDGAYWWRVRAVDAAGTDGLWSDVARVAKTWPNQIAGTRLAATPNGPSASFTALNPYLFWNAVPGAKSYDVEVSPGDQFNNVIFSGTNAPQPFATPAAGGALPDDSYNWRVRARDPKGNAGPWTVASTFTKAWSRPTQVAPADGATTHDLPAVVGADRRRPALRGPDHAPGVQLERVAPGGRGLDRGDRVHADAERGEGPRHDVRAALVARPPGRRAASTAPGRPRGGSTGAPPARPTAAPTSRRRATRSPGCRPRCRGGRSPARPCTGSTSPRTPSSTTWSSSRSSPARRGPRARRCPTTRSAPATTGAWCGATGPRSRTST